MYHRLLSLALSLIATIAFIAQASEAQALPGTPVKAPAKAQFQQLKSGLRFILKAKDASGNGLTPYVMINEKKFVPISLQSTIPGEWVPIPKDRVLRIYDSIPAALQKTNASTPSPAKPTKKPGLLYSGDIPPGLSNKILVLVTVTKEGKLQLEYFDESQLAPGVVYFKNLTSRHLLLNIPDAPGNEKKTIELTPGQSHSFGSSFSAAPTQSYKGALFHQVPIKNMGDRWMPLLKFSIVRYEKRSIITFLFEDPENKQIIFNKIMIYCDR